MDHWQLWTEKGENKARGRSIIYYFILVSTGFIQLKDKEVPIVVNLLAYTPAVSKLKRKATSGEEEAFLKAKNH